MKKSILLTLLIIFSFSANLKAQKLNRIERKIIEKVKSFDDASLSFLEKVVNINSGTLNLSGVKEVGDVLSDYLVQKN
ncbi:MAG: hypothetical protein H8E16_07250 [Flavobacteriales bacterium]|nr:hypothetical protein [Flavobacteriales bacterium]